jgi:5-methyltetrahydropteroyltriglutamate--homocysteine methyltransferase
MADSVFRAEPVGSLIRPAEITTRINAIFAGLACASPRFAPPGKAVEFGELARLSDRYVAEFARRQAEAGLSVVTDGEIRRSTFLSSFYDGVDGFAAPDAPFAVTDANGEVYEGYNDPRVSGRIRKAGSPAAAEAAVLRTLDLPVPFKITFPAPSYFYDTTIVEEEADSQYPDRQSFVDDVIAVERQLVSEAIAAGARWVQFDFPLYPGIADPAYAPPVAAGHGWTVDELLTRAIDADTRVTADIPEGVTIGMHICRGNFAGGFWQGSLGPVAERLFGELPHDRFLIEWEDTDREGDYSPLRHVPPGKTVALGLVSTKTPELEADDDIARRLDEASRYLPLDQLALCPQCGFASLMSDRLVQAEDAQWRKLDLVGRVAERVWG